MQKGLPKPKGTQRREGLREGSGEPGQENVTLISSITFAAMGASLSIEGSVDGESFRIYLTDILCPAAGQIVAMDNLSGRRSKFVGEQIQAQGCEFCSCPPTRRT